MVGDWGAIVAVCNCIARAPEAKERMAAVAGGHRKLVTVSNIVPLCCASARLNEIYWPHYILDYIPPDLPPHLPSNVDRKAVVKPRPNPPLRDSISQTLKLGP